MHVDTYNPNPNPITLTLIRFALLTSAFWFAAIFVGDTARTKWPAWLPYSYPIPLGGRAVSGDTPVVCGGSGFGSRLGSSAPYTMRKAQPLTSHWVRGSGAPMGAQIHRALHRASGTARVSEPGPPPKSPSLPPAVCHRGERERPFELVPSRSPTTLTLAYPGEFFEVGVEYVADAASRRDNLTRPIYYRVYDDLSPSSQVHLGVT